MVTGLVGAALLLAGMFWFLARRGVARWAGLAVAALAVVALIWSYAAADVILVAILTLALLAAALAAARWALDEEEETWMPAPPRPIRSVPSS